MEIGSGFEAGHVDSFLKEENVSNAIYFERCPASSFPESCRIQNTSGVNGLVLIYRKLRSRAVTKALGSKARPNLTQSNEHLT